MHRTVRYPAVISTRHPAKEQLVDALGLSDPQKMRELRLEFGPVASAFPIEMDVAASIRLQVHERYLHVFVPDRLYRTPPGQG